MVETEVRVATELVAVNSTMGEVRDLLKTHLDDRDQLADHEARLQRLEAKVG
ncbi:MAG: hypothetical protein AAGF12_05525 [Myxococcota bacterium]